MRRRIVTAIVAVTALAVALFGIPLAVTLHHLYVADARSRLEHEATLASRDLPADLAANTDPIDLPSGGTAISLGVYAPDGHKLHGDGPDAGGPAVLDAARNLIGSHETKDQLIAAVPLVSNDNVVAVLRAQTSIEPAEHRAHVAWALMGALAAFIVAVAASLAFVQANRLTRPLRRVRDDATRLGGGDFTVDVPTTGVAELDALGQAITSTAHRLGQAMEREQAFTTNASHQLRTPITAMRLLLETELAAPRADPTEVVTDGLQVTGRLQSTVDDLLRLARGPRGVERLDIEQLYHHLHAHWYRTLAAHDRTLVLQRTPEAFTATFASNAAIRQAIDVLVDNAIRHGAGTVYVSAAMVEGGDVLRVQDEGAGPELSNDELFGARGATADGHGIGLGIARTLIDHEGGRLLLRSGEPHTTFEIYLPRVVS